jgi:hypothetical protein
LNSAFDVRYFFVMTAKPNSLVRIFLVLALALAALPALPFGACDRPAAGCGCCPVPEAAGCCSAVENEAPPQNLPAPESPSQASLRAAWLPLLPVLAILPPLDETSSSSFPQSPSRCVLTGHSRQSILCVRLV